MFLPIQVSDPPPAELGRSEAPHRRQPDSRIEITLPEGIGLRVGADVDAAALRRVLAALRRRSLSLFCATALIATACFLSLQIEALA
jgi:hypothetical protein